MRPDDEEVFKKDGFRCVYCGHDGRTFEGWKFLVVDHFKPRTKGGGKDLSNLNTACLICNLMKGAQEWPSLDEAKEDIEEWHSKMRIYWEKVVKPLL